MNVSAVQTVKLIGQMSPAVKTIITGLKMLAEGFSYFVYLPLKIMGLQPSPFLAQLIYIGVLAWIINRFVKNWAYTLAIIVILLLIGSFI